MSFGFSISDVISLISLIKKACDGWRGAGAEFKDIVRTLSSFAILLEGIQHRFEDLETSADVQRRKSDLSHILQGCKDAVEELRSVWRRYKRMRDRDRLAVGLRDISAPKERLVRHNGLLQTFLMTFEFESLGKNVQSLPRMMERMPHVILSALPVALGQVLDARAADTCTARSSVMTTYGDDDRQAYRELRRSLRRLGLRDSEVRSQKHRLVALMKSIVTEDETAVVAYSTAHVLSATATPAANDSETRLASDAVNAEEAETSANVSSTEARHGDKHDEALHAETGRKLGDPFELACGLDVVEEDSDKAGAPVIRKSKLSTPQEHESTKPAQKVSLESGPVGDTPAGTEAASKRDSGIANEVSSSETTTGTRDEHEIVPSYAVDAPESKVGQTMTARLQLYQAYVEDEEESWHSDCAVISGGIDGPLFESLVSASPSPFSQPEGVNSPSDRASETPMSTWRNASPFSRGSSQNVPDDVGPYEDNGYLRRGRSHSPFRDVWSTASTAGEICGSTRAPSLIGTRDHSAPPESGRPKRSQVTTGHTSDDGASSTSRLTSEDDSSDTDLSCASRVAISSHHTSRSKPQVGEGTSSRIAGGHTSRPRARADQTGAEKVPTSSMRSSPGRGRRLEYRPLDPMVDGPLTVYVRLPHGFSIHIEKGLVAQYYDNFAEPGSRQYYEILPDFLHPTPRAKACSHGLVTWNYVQDLYASRSGVSRGYCGCQVLPWTQYLQEHNENFLRDLRDWVARLHEQTIRSEPPTPETSDESDDAWSTTAQQAFPVGSPPPGPPPPSFDVPHAKTTEYFRPTYGARSPRHGSFWPDPLPQFPEPPPPFLAPPPFAHFGTVPPAEQLFAPYMASWAPLHPSTPAQNPFSPTVPSGNPFSPSTPTRRHPDNPFSPM